VKLIDIAFKREFKQIYLLLEYENSCMVLDYKSSKKFEGKYTYGMVVYLLEEGVELVGV